MSQDVSLPTAAVNSPAAPRLRVPSTAWIGILAIAASILVPGALGNQYWTYTFTLVTLYVIVAVMQNMLVSEAGQMSFGQGAVFGIAAVTAAVMTGLHGQPFWLSAIGGIAAGLVLGALFAAPALRVQGYYLGFVTLSAALVFPQLLIALDSITGGVNGVPAFVMSLATPVFGTVTPLSLLAVLFAALALLFHAVLPHTALGRKMIVVSNSPEAAQSLGIHPGIIRSIAFLIAALGTAIAGVLYVPLVGFVGPTAFRVDFSIFFFFAVIVGGQGKLLGPIIGVWLLHLVPNVLLADFSHYRLLIYGLVALVVMLSFPDGVVGSLSKWFASRRGGSDKVAISLHDAFVNDDTPVSQPARSARSEACLIAVTGARKSFGNAVALDGASLTVREGTIHGLVGPNGSGKTSMLNTISGFMPLDAGRVELFGRDVTGLAPWRRTRLGLGRTFQTPRIFDRLSIWDNVRLGREGYKNRAGKSRLVELSAFASKWQQQDPSLLPHGQRRLLEILRVMESDARVILLDEPAGGLSPEERADLAALLVHFRDRMGKTILLVEHDLSMVWSVADDITVMETGTVAAAGLPHEIKSNPKVRALFTGGRDA
ncbi:MAG TPA: ATP-binding cassette domain-containing protein [Rhizobiaceae bacterium]|nr:ATP-binding cassette domain-containing protein [Rhizobiaceae bacterium]